MPNPSLLDRIDSILKTNDDRPQAIQETLEAVARGFEAVSATLHRADKGAGLLLMEASIGIPDPVKQMTEKIPFGKGMAGICYKRAEVVTVCNLQTDDSGVAKPGAKETQVAGAIVIPIFDEQGEEVIGTLGVGKPHEHEYTQEEQKVLADCAKKISEKWTA